MATSLRRKHFNGIVSWQHGIIHQLTQPDDTAMAVTKENFDQFKVDRLKNYLEDMAEKGQPCLYEIFVDSLKVVRKTDDCSDFDNYERYMHEDTEKVRIVIYSGQSNRNEQYIFYVQNKPKQEANGLGEIDTIVQKELAARDREHAMDALRKELEETKKQLAEAEEYHQVLEQQLEAERSNQNKRKLHIGEMLSLALEGMARRNPQWISKVPVVGETLAGIISADNEYQQQQLQAPAPDAETTASFSKKGMPPTTGSTEQLPYIQLLQQLETVFNEEQLALLWQVLTQFMEEPSKLATVAGLLNITLPSKGN